MRGRRLELKWQKFGKLLVLDYKDFTKGSSYRKCKCDCWKEVFVQGSALNSGGTKSCGCGRVEYYKNWGSRKTHQMSSTRIYSIWHHIPYRCNNIKSPKYKDYGWRGIKCMRKNFQEFMEDMYESYLEHVEKYWIVQTSLDRIDNNWNYCKENCMRATKKEQSNNTRSNRILECNWQRKTLSQRMEVFWLKYVD